MFSTVTSLHLFLRHLFCAFIWSRKLCRNSNFFFIIGCWPHAAQSWEWVIRIEQCQSSVQFDTQKFIFTWNLLDFYFLLTYFQPQGIFSFIPLLYLVFYGSDELLHHQDCKTFFCYYFINYRANTWIIMTLNKLLFTEMDDWWLNSVFSLKNWICRTLKWFVIVP